jgi:hypothetical protein
VQRRVANGCAAGSSIRAIAQDGTVTCQSGSGYTAGEGLALAGTEFRVVDGGVTEGKLAFDPATQSELDTGLTSLNADNLTTGTIPNNRLGGAYSNTLTFSNSSNTFIGHTFLGSQGVFTSPTGSMTPLTVRGATGQTENLQTWKDAAGNAVAGVSADGAFQGDGSSLTGLDASNLASGTVPDARLSGDVARNSSLSTAGTINDPSNPLEWTKLKNVPGVVADPSQLQRRVFDTCATGEAIRAVHDDGTVACEPISGGGGGGGWSMTGNAGTDSSNFIGTSDNQPLNLKVNGQRALRLEPKAQSPNVIGGHGENSVTPSTVGATIGGGGSSSAPNVALAEDFGTIGGGEGNVATGAHATVAGGNRNRAASTASTVGGGIQNFAAFDATVAGGEGNTASGDGSSVGGGFSNHAEGQRAVVPGGSFNEAIGSFSFAAGSDAHADHFGSFVWGDGGSSTHTTGMSQFVVRASGGLHLLDGQLFCEGCVTLSDIDPKAMPGIKGYCALAQANPHSFPDAPCRKRLETVDTLGHVTSIAIGTDSNPVLGYWGPGNVLKVARCSDPGCAGRTLQTLDTITFASASIAIGTDGNPVISYAPSDGSLKVARCGDPACAASTLRTLDTFAGQTSIAIGTDGNPVISYTGPGGLLKVAHCDDAACTTSSLRSLDTFGKYTSIVIGTDGNPVISYAGPGFALKVARCGDPVCTASTRQTLDTHSFDTSIAIGTDGNPVVSYEGSASGTELKVARCGDPACVESTLKTLDAVVASVAPISMAIGIDGNPVVSYVGPASALKVASCSDAGCSAATLQTLDSSGDFPSIATGTDGIPVVSYSGPGNVLKVARPAISN